MGLTASFLLRAGSGLFTAARVVAGMMQPAYRGHFTASADPDPGKSRTETGTLPLRYRFMSFRPTFMPDRTTARRMRDHKVVAAIVASDLKGSPRRTTGTRQPATE